MSKAFSHFLLISLCSVLQIQAQTSYEQGILNFRKEKDSKYLDSLKTPIPDEYLADFAGLKYFEVDENYLVKANLIRNKKPVPYKFSTTNSEQKRRYLVYGTVDFTLKGKKSKLTLYYAPVPMAMRKKKRTLFLPFRDESNGVSTYGGGRYLELEIPEGDELMIDFNKAFNPLCAYGGKYACVIPPRDNKIALEVKAGEKDFIP